MSYCGPQGIPHSEFLRWSEDDQDKAIAFVLHERSNCGQCGTNPDDWLDDDGYPVEPPPYTADTLRCYGCVAVAEARANIPDDRTEEFHVFLRPNRD